MMFCSDVTLREYNGSVPAKHNAGALGQAAGGAPTVTGGP